jgi:hypothetical protein
MGHADRPWRHDSLSLDAQPRGVRLSVARGRRHSHSHSNIHTYRNTDANSHCNCNGNTDIHACAYSKTYSDAEAASYAATAAIAGN